MVVEELHSLHKKLSRNENQPQHDQPWTMNYPHS